MTESKQTKLAWSIASSELITIQSFSQGPVFLIFIICAKGEARAATSRTITIPPKFAAELAPGLPLTWKIWKSGNLKETSESQRMCLKSQGICDRNPKVREFCCPKFIFSQVENPNFENFLTPLNGLGLTVELDIGLEKSGNFILSGKWQATLSVNRSTTRRYTSVHTSKSYGRPCPMNS